MDFKRVPLTMLCDGAILASGIYDASGRLLLRANVPITRELLATLYKRNINNVVISQKDWTGLASLHASAADWIEGIGPKAFENASC